MNKRCFKCHRTKPLDRFYVHRQMADGHLNKCKACTKRDVAARYASPEGRQKCREYDATRFHRPERKEQVARYQRQRRANKPGKTRARVAVCNAIRDGRLVRQECEVPHCCSRGEAHHRDYRKPLTVQWLCFKHHRELEHGQTVG